MLLRPGLLGRQQDQAARFQFDSAVRSNLRHIAITPVLCDTLGTPNSGQNLSVFWIDHSGKLAPALGEFLSGDLRQYSNSNPMAPHLLKHRDKLCHFILSRCARLWDCSGMFTAGPSAAVSDNALHLLSCVRRVDFEPARNTSDRR